jgi:hypothetical protein
MLVNAVYGRRPHYIAFTNMLVVGDYSFGLFHCLLRLRLVSECKHCSKNIDVKTINIIRHSFEIHDLFKSSPLRHYSFPINVPFLSLNYALRLENFYQVFEFQRCSNHLFYCFSFTDN